MRNTASPERDGRKRFGGIGVAAVDLAQQDERGRRPSGRRMKATQAFIESLLAEGVEVIFGYPGGAVLPIYDALYDAKIRHVLVRHEQGAAHMADGYARATGKPGVVLATSGPGATNLVTGLATAWMDSIPMVAFTGNVARSAIGSDAFQEADITGITLPITKHNFLVRDGQRTCRGSSRGVPHRDHGPARPGAGRPAQGRSTGGDRLRLPRDGRPSGLQADDQGPHEPDSRGGPGHRRGQAAGALRRAAAPSPVGAHEEVLALAEKANLPTTITLMGIGGFPGDHPLSLGMLGMHGTVYANYAVERVRPAHRGGRPLRRPRDGRSRQVRSPRQGDPHRHRPGGDRQERPGRHSHRRRREGRACACWWRRCERSGSRSGSRRSRPGSGSTRCQLRGEDGRSCPQRVIEEIYEVTGGEAICTADVGQHQMWARPVLQLPASRAGTSRRAAWGPWASAFRRPSAPRWAGPTAGLVDHGRRRVPDDHPGAGHGRRVQHPGEDRHHQQLLPGDGAAVAGDASTSGTTPTPTCTTTLTSSSSPRRTGSRASADPAGGAAAALEKARGHRRSRPAGHPRGPRRRTSSR